MAIQHLHGQACGTRILDPNAAVFLQMINYKSHSLDELRKIPISELKFAGPPQVPYPAQDVQQLKVTSDSIRILVFNPTHGRDLPVIINYHGGGFIAPLIPGLEYSLWQEAKTFGAVVFAVDYRVAPENKFPIPLNDSFNAFKWIAENAAEFGGDTSKITLIGNSAGANLVAVLAQRARKDKIEGKIKLQVLNGLPADCRPEHMENAVSYQENATGYFLSKADCYFALENYAPGQGNNPEISPALAKDFKGLPPAVVISAEFDPLRDDGALYSGKLRAAGVKVWEKCFPGQIHCLIGVQPGSVVMNDYVALVKSAMNEVYLKQNSSLGKGQN